MTVVPAEDQSRLANAIRALAMDAVQAANSGHPGMPMGMADVATVLYQRYLKFDPKAPKWWDRDRFVLSAGHGSMLAYATLHVTGYARPTIFEISVNSAVSVPGIPKISNSKASKRRQDHWAKVLPQLWAWPSPNGI
jgi:transketolase